MLGSKQGPYKRNGDRDGSKNTYVSPTFSVTGCDREDREKIGFFLVNDVIQI